MSSTILLADDSLTIQKVVELTFADTDFTVVAVSSGEDLLQQLPTTRPDLVICDVIMPGTDGYDVCQRIKSEPATLHIPVILLTGTFEPFDRDRALAAGCSEIITKPFEARKLVETVERLLGEGGATAVPSPQPEAPAPAPQVAPPPPMPPGPAEPDEATQLVPPALQRPSETQPATPSAPAVPEVAPPQAQELSPEPTEPPPQTPAPPARPVASDDEIDFTTTGFAEMEAAAQQGVEVAAPPEEPDEGLDFDLSPDEIAAAEAKARAEMAGQAVPPRPETPSDPFASAEPPAAVPEPEPDPAEAPFDPFDPDTAPALSDTEGAGAADPFGASEPPPDMTEEPAGIPMMDSPFDDDTPAPAPEPSELAGGLAGAAAGLGLGASESDRAYDEPPRADTTPSFEVPESVRPAASEPEPGVFDEPAEAAVGEMEIEQPAAPGWQQAAEEPQQAWDQESPVAEAAPWETEDEIAEEPISSWDPDAEPSSAGDEPWDVSGGPGDVSLSSWEDEQTPVQPEHGEPLGGLDEPAWAGAQANEPEQAPEDGSVGQVEAEPVMGWGDESGPMETEASEPSPEVMQWDIDADAMGSQAPEPASEERSAWQLEDQPVAPAVEVEPTVAAEVGVSVESPATEPVIDEPPIGLDPEHGTEAAAAEPAAQPEEQAPTATDPAWAAQTAPADAFDEVERAETHPVVSPPALERPPASEPPPHTGELSDEDVDRVARRVLELARDTIEKVAWEVIPDMAEIVVRERVRELERELEPGSSEMEQPLQ